jgi:hypothetical protein
MGLIPSGRNLMRRLYFVKKYTFLGFSKLTIVNFSTSTHSNQAVLIEQIQTAVAKINTVLCLKASPGAKHAH